MTNTLKNKKGFTLTELIVVIVVIGILAAVLIPTLTGYIDRARVSAAEQEAQPIANAYETWYLEHEAGTLTPTDQTFAQYIAELELDANGTLAVTADGADSDTLPDGFTYTAKNGYKVTYSIAAGRATKTGTSK